MELWRNSGRSAAKVAAELGIRAPLLYRWARPRRQGNVSGNEPKSGRTVEELEAEIRRLRAENAKLLEQREVLKKITGHLLRSAAQRYARIEQMSGQYKTAWLCEALLVSRSGYYRMSDVVSPPRLVNGETAGHGIARRKVMGVNGKPDDDDGFAALAQLESA